MIKKPVLVFITNVDWAFVSHRIPIALEAIKKGFEVHLISKRTDCGSFLKDQGIIFHNWNLNRSSLNPFLILSNIFQLYSLIKKSGKYPTCYHIKPILMSGIIRFFEAYTNYICSCRLSMHLIQKQLRQLLLKI